MRIAMETDDEQAPPAKQRKLETDLSVNGRKATAQRIKSSNASEVSRRLYSDTETADVFFTFKDSNERVPAHKCVLANASKMLRTLVYSPMAPNILLHETPTEAFKVVMQFCYLDEVKIKLDQIADVMKLLDRYEMTESLQLCGRFWVDNWSVDSICSVYSYAVNSRETEFREFCESKICAHSDAVFKTDGFLSCLYNVLDHILSLKSLPSDEPSKLSACLKWAQKQCELIGQNSNKLKNLRAHLRDVPNQIRCSSGKNDVILQHWTMLKKAESSKKLEQRKKEQSVQYVFPKKERCRERQAIGSIVNVLETNRAISLFGFDTVRMMSRGGGLLNKIPVHLSIREQQKNGRLKLIYEERLGIMKMTNDYVQLQPKPAQIKPNCQYHIEFEFESELKIQYVDEVADSTLEFEDLNIQIRTECKTAKCLIKGLNFMKGN